jgi:hypothetical protein
MPEQANAEEDGSRPSGELGRRSAPARSPAILAHHERDIVMFDLPPPLQCRGIEAYKQTWDLFFR